MDATTTYRPTNEGKMCEGKLEPAKPHLTNPVPLSLTTTYLYFLLKNKIKRNIFSKRGEGFGAGGRRQEAEGNRLLRQ